MNSDQDVANPYQDQVASVITNELKIYWCTNCQEIIAAFKGISLVGNSLVKIKLPTSLIATLSRCRLVAAAVDGGRSSCPKKLKADSDVSILDN